MHVKTGDIQLRSGSLVLYQCQYPAFDNVLHLSKIRLGKAGERVYAIFVISYKLKIISKIFFKKNVEIYANQKWKFKKNKK